MASSITSKKLLLPNMDVNEPVEFSFFESPQTLAYRKYTSNDISQSNISWSITPPGVNSVLNKRVYRALTVDLTVTGSAPIGQYVFNTNYCVPRCLPIGSVLQSEVLTLNNTQNSLNVSDILSAMTRYGSTYEQLAFDWGYAPSQLDFLNSYDAMNGAPNSPFNPSYDQIFAVPSRGAYPKKIMANPVSTNPLDVLTATIRYTFYEPVYVPPCSVDDTSNNEKGLANLYSFELNDTFTNDLTRMFSRRTLPAGTTWSSLSVTIIEANLYMKWESLPQNIVPNPSIDYSYNIYDIYQTNLGTITGTPGVLQSFPSNAVEFKRIPQNIMIFVRPSNSTKTITQPDYFCPIKNVSISYQLVDGQLNTASEMQLYEICRKNGLKSTSWPLSMMAQNNNIDVYGTSGVTQIQGASCPIMLSIPDDIYLAPGNTVGVSSVSQFQVTVQFENFITSPLTLYVVAVTPAIFSLSRSFSNVSSVFLSPGQADLLPYHSANEDELSGNGLYGGKFNFGKVKRFIKSAYHGVKKALPYIRSGLEVASRVPMLSDVASIGKDILTEGDIAYGLAKDVARGAKGGRLMTNKQKMALVRSYKNNYIR